MENKWVIKELIFVYIHIILLLLIIAFYIINKFYFRINFSGIDSYTEYSMEICIGILSMLLTLLGLFTALPNTEYRKRMKKYKHDYIILNNIFFGSLSCIVFITFSILGLCNSKLPYFLLYSIGTTVVVSYYMFQTSKYIN